MGRGLCGMCYKRANQNDTLLDHAPFRRSAIATIEDYEFIKATYGGDLKSIAARMNMGYDALWYRLKRHGVKHV